jgi:CHAD domain-containing protein
MSHTSAQELVIRQRVSALSRELPAARAGDVNAIHQARVATRRLREALPLLASGSKARKLERTARRLTRALGPVRELDVALEMLDGLAKSGEAPAMAIDRLRQLVLEERRGSHAEAAACIDRCDVERMRRRAVAGIRHTPVAGSRAAGAGRSLPAWRRAARRAERLRAAIENAASIYLPDRLHKVRIAVKKLRYTMEIARQVGATRAPRPAGSPRSARSVAGQLATLKRAQDLLGRMHDLEVLIARTRAVQSSPSSPNLRLSGDFDVLVRRLETECRQLHGHYMASRSPLLDICDRVIVAADRASQRASAA